MALMNPSISISGDKRETLVDQRREVMDAIYKAMKAMQETAPHGRNYIGKDYQYSLDKAVYRGRFAMLDKLYNEIQEEALAIMNGGK